MNSMHSTNARKPKSSLSPAWHLTGRHSKRNFILQPSHKCMLSGRVTNHRKAQHSKTLANGIGKLLGRPSQLLKKRGQSANPIARDPIQVGLQAFGLRVSDLWAHQPPKTLSGACRRLRPAWRGGIGSGDGCSCPVLENSHGCGSQKFKGWGNAGFGLCFHFPRAHLGYIF